MRVSRFCASLACSIFSVLFPLSLQAQAPVRILAPLDEGARITLRGNVPPQTRHAADLGEVAPATPLRRMLLVLKLGDEQDTALRQLIEDQQNAASPSFHQWLTPAQFRARFAPAAEDRQAVTQWLASHGFTIDRISSSGSMIEFSGTAGAVKQAFGTGIHRYLLQGNDTAPQSELHIANAADPQIPAALAGVVAGVASLNDFRKTPGVHKLGPANRIGNTSTWQPQFTINAQPSAVHYLAPGDFAKIYSTAPLYASGIDGSGQTIAIVGRTNINRSDVQLFRLAFGLPANDPKIILDGVDPGDFEGSSDESEADLDVEWAGAVAPKATIDFVVSQSTDATDGVDLSALYIVDNNLAPVLSTSYGACEASLGATELAFYNTLWEQAAAQGITVVVASGDSGAAACDAAGGLPASKGPAVNGIASSPYAIAAGGTAFNENGQDANYWSAQNGPDQSSALGYIPEQVWNESCSDITQCGFISLYSSGGGPSAQYPKPPWQNAPGVPNDGKRDLPDISLASAAQHDGLLLCQDGICITDSTGALIQAEVVGGTSAAAPAFAAVMALVNQKTGARQGQANFVLYPLAASQTANCNASGPPAPGCIFNDVTAGNNTVPGQAGYNAAPGYDLATGLGSVNANNLVNGWGSVVFRSTTTQLQAASTQLQHGQPVNLSVTVAAKSGTPSGAVSLLAGTAAAVVLGELNNGTYTGTLANLPGGSYSLQATYGGDGAYAASLSNALPITVAPEASSTSFAIDTFDNSGKLVPTGSVSYSNVVYLQTSVAGASHQGNATGTVTFTDTFNGVAIRLASSALNSQSGILTYNDTLAIGTHSIVASYSGDASFNPSASGPVNITVTKGSSDTLLFLPSGSLPNQPVTLQALVIANGYGAPTGTVQFYNGSAPLGAPVQVKQQVATLSTSQLAAGSNTIKATYAGDAAFAGSVSTPANIYIGNPDFQLGINPGNLTVTASAPGKATLLLSPGPGLGYGGDVTFSCSGLPANASCTFQPATVTLDGFTTASTAVTIASTGAHAFLAPRNRPLFRDAGALGGISVSGALLLFWPTRRRRMGILLGSALVCIAAACAGCGGGSSSSATTTTPASTPPPAASGNPVIVTITATATSSVGNPVGALTHSVTIAATFQ